MEQVHCCLCDGSLMEMCIMLCGDGWWGVSMRLMKGGLNTSISARSQGRMAVDTRELSFLLMCKSSFVLKNV